MKNGGSLSAKDALLSRISLLDFSNHFSALLLSPELSLPSGCKLDGESLSPFDPLVFRLLGTALSLEESLGSFGGGDGLRCGEWRSDTDRWAGGRRGCFFDDAAPGCAGGVITIVGCGSWSAIGNCRGSSRQIRIHVCRHDMVWQAQVTLSRFNSGKSIRWWKCRSSFA